MPKLILAIAFACLHGDQLALIANVGVRYAMSMEEAEPWFRKSALGVAPTCWQGGAVILITYLTAIPLGLFALLLAKSSPITSQICAGLFIADIVISNVIVSWKLEQNYGR